MADDPDARVTGTRLTLNLNATVSISTGADWNDWVKPGVAFSISFDGIPSEDQLRASTEFIGSQILSPVLEDVIVLSQQKLEEARRNR
jgi:hypothetical protein